MKKLCIALVLLLLTTASASAQEEEYRPNRRQRGGGIVGGGGGVTSTWMFMNTGKLNSALAEKGCPTLSEDGLFMFGGQGHA